MLSASVHEVPQACRQVQAIVRVRQAHVLAFRPPPQPVSHPFAHDANLRRRIVFECRRRHDTRGKCIGAYQHVDATRYPPGKRPLPLARQIDVASGIEAQVDYEVARVVGGNCGIDFLAKVRDRLAIHVEVHTHLDKQCLELWNPHDAEQVCTVLEIEGGVLRSEGAPAFLGFPGPWSRRPYAFADLSLRQRRLRHEFQRPADVTPIRQLQTQAHPVRMACQPRGMQQPLLFDQPLEIPAAIRIHSTAIVTQAPEYLGRRQVIDAEHTSAQQVAVRGVSTGDHPPLREPEHAHRQARLGPPGIARTALHVVTVVGKGCDAQYAEQELLARHCIGRREACVDEMHRRRARLRREDLAPEHIAGLGVLEIFGSGPRAHGRAESGREQRQSEHCHEPGSEIRKRHERPLRSRQP